MSKPTDSELLQGFKERLEESKREHREQGFSGRSNALEPGTWLAEQLAARARPDDWERQFALALQREQRASQDYNSLVDRFDLGRHELSRLYDKYSGGTDGNPGPEWKEPEPEG